MLAERAEGGAPSANEGPQARGRTWDVDRTHPGGTNSSKSAAVDAVDAPEEETRSAKNTEVWNIERSLGDASRAASHRRKSPRTAVFVMFGLAFGTACSRNGVSEAPNPGPEWLQPYQALT
jgi:hypothetical protein